MQLLTKDITFPSVKNTTPEGIVAFGGDLSSNRIICAYKNGIFPWYSDDQPILWWSPDPRAIIPLDGLHIGRTLKKVLKKNIFTITINAAFEKVITACEKRSDGSRSGWITDEMMEAYINLHKLGHAKSIETWHNGELVGGLYGIAMNGFFAGESMFYRKANASKVALVGLVEHLNKQGFLLLDCQMVTELTRTMGAVEIRRDEYLKRLKKALTIKCTFQ